MAKTKRKTKATRAKSKMSKKKIAAKSAARAKTRKPQRFVVSHHREEDFDGMVQAHVIRMTKPFSAEEVAIPHFHDVDFQMVYVLKGWFRSEFEGQGPHTFHAGSCWIQPPRIKHTVLGYSDDCELLEIVLPADFETVTLK
jgi:quercetin dioxygenase-like cupin family protein